MNASIELQQDTLIFRGDWTVKGTAAIQENPLKGIVLPTYPLKIEGAEITQLDTAGVLLLQGIEKLLQQQNIPVTRQNFHPEQDRFIELIITSQAKVTEVSKPTLPNPLARVGIFTVGKYEEFVNWLTFIGEFFLVSLRLLANPLRIKWKYLLSVVEMMGYRALPIIAFLSFLIGVVLTYQIGLELRLYGANIYIVNLLGMSVFREFGPLITAIILAGRTSSAFTAQLGLMKANEEIDALQTMGLSPSELLTFPRIFGLILVMPLLVVWSDIFAIFGGMLMSKSILGISYYSFLEQFPQVVTLTSFTIGLCKAPAFAIIIAAVGCYHGFRVTGSSESIGWQTTKSVVLAIFLIIIADALFSIILSWWKI